MARLQLFGVGTKNESAAITAQRRINCLVETREELDRTNYALVGRPGLIAFVESLGDSPSRGMWAVNSLSQPLLFTVHGMGLYSINNAGVTSLIGALNTATGDVSMADDGTYLVIVDGTYGYWYNMAVPGALTQITDGNFTTTPKTVTWQDQYFIVTAGTGRQFQLSQIGPVSPAVWPAIQINFTGSGAASLQAGISDHSILHLFAYDYTEFWQNAGSPDFPFAVIPGSAQEFGLASAWSLAKYDNSLTGLFRNKMGGVNVSRVSGFRLQRLSDHDIEYIMATYPQSSIGAATGYSFMIGGHPLYVINFPSYATHVYNGLSNTWTEFSAPDGTRFWGNKFAVFQGRLCTSDYRNGNIYQFDLDVYDDDGDEMPFEVVSKHIWQDDKYLGIPWLQVDIESGAGTATGQGSDPVMDLQVSQDGGRTFYSVGYSSMGPIGEFTTRVTWNSLGAARDWVLKLRITDPIHRVVTGASAEVTGWSF